MAKRKSKIVQKIKQLGNIQVNDWDFAGLLNTNLKDLEITQSLRSLGSIQVMEWDFRSVMPAVKKVANTELDVVDYVKRAAFYRVTDWDIMSPFRVSSDSAKGESAETKRESATPLPMVHLADSLSAEKMQALIVQLKNFLQYVAINLIDEPNHAQIKVAEIAPKVLRFKLLLVKKDLGTLVGREGHTAAAIRNVLKAMGATRGVNVLLDIHSHEQETMLLAKKGHHF